MLALSACCSRVSIRRARVVLTARDGPRAAARVTQFSRATRLASCMQMHVPRGRPGPLHVHEVRGVSRVHASTLF